MIEETLAALHQKKIILYPTDTVWGIANPAIIEELQRKLPTPIFFTSTDGCTVAYSVELIPVLALL